MEAPPAEHANPIRADGIALIANVRFNAIGINSACFSDDVAAMFNSVESPVAPANAR